MNASIALAKLGRCPGCTRPVPLVRSIDAWQRCNTCEWEWRLDGRSEDRERVTLLVRQPAELVREKAGALFERGVR